MYRHVWAFLGAYFKEDLPPPFLFCASYDVCMYVILFTRVPTLFCNVM